MPDYISTFYSPLAFKVKQKSLYVNKTKWFQPQELTLMYYFIFSPENHHFGLLKREPKAYQDENQIIREPMICDDWSSLILFQSVRYTQKWEYIYFLFSN